MITDQRLDTIERWIVKPILFGCLAAVWVLIVANIIITFPKKASVSTLHEALAAYVLIFFFFLTLSYMRMTRPKWYALAELGAGGATIFALMNLGYAEVALIASFVAAMFLSVEGVARLAKSFGLQTRVAEVRARFGSS